MSAVRPLQLVCLSGIRYRRFPGELSANPINPLRVQPEYLGHHVVDLLSGRVDSHLGKGCRVLSWSWSKARPSNVIRSESTALKSGTGSDRRVSSERRSTSIFCGLPWSAASGFASNFPLQVTTFSFYKGRQAFPANSATRSPKASICWIVTPRRERKWFQPTNVTP